MEHALNPLPQRCATPKLTAPQWADGFENNLEGLGHLAPGRQSWQGMNESLSKSTTMACSQSINSQSGKQRPGLREAGCKGKARDPKNPRHGHLHSVINCCQGDRHHPVCDKIVQRPLVSQHQAHCTGLPVVSLSEALGCPALTSSSFWSKGFSKCWGMSSLNPF